jgi:gamma-glutamylcyclotransferase (GGCT)/AIG2-like uncharacterized protein YtfP
MLNIDYDNDFSYTRISPYIVCKDFFNDVVYRDNYKPEFKAQIYSWSVPVPWHASIMAIAVDTAHTKRFFKNFYKYVSKAEKELGIPETVVEVLEDNQKMHNNGWWSTNHPQFYALEFDDFWKASPWKIGLYMFLIRLCYHDVGGDTIAEWLENIHKADIREPHLGPLAGQVEGMPAIDWLLNDMADFDQVDPDEFSIGKVHNNSGPIALINEYLTGSGHSIFAKLVQKAKKSRGHTLLGVYGLLKEGASEHHRLEGAELYSRKMEVKGAKLLNKVHTSAIRTSERNSRVEVEVWSISDKKILKALDAYEGHPKLFKRTRLKTVEGEAVYVYLLQQAA